MECAGIDGALDCGSAAQHSAVRLCLTGETITKISAARLSLAAILQRDVCRKAAGFPHWCCGKAAIEPEDSIDAFERGELTAVDGPSAIEKFVRLSRNAEYLFGRPQATSQRPGGA